MPGADESTVYDVIANGLAEAGALISQYHHLVSDSATTDLDALARVQQQLENVKMN